MVWLRRSVWPSVRGQNTVDIHGRLPEYLRNSFHVSDMKREFRSETISDRSPWSLQISRAKMIARSFAVFPSFVKGRKFAILV